MNSTTTTTAAAFDRHRTTDSVVPAHPPPHPPPHQHPHPHTRLPAHTTTPQCLDVHQKSSPAKTSPTAAAKCRSAVRRSSARDAMEIGTHHHRLSNGSSSTNSSSSSIGSGGAHGGREIHVAVLGSQGVGKSALIVRYLTRRFIGDYDPEMEAIFTHSATVDNKQIVMHVMDTACHPTGREGREDPMSWADGFLLLFSLTEAASWAYVQELVTRLRSAREDERLPVAIAANKSDLVHLRRVASGDCAAWAAEHGCEFREVSVREDPDGVEELFLCLCRQVRAAHKHKRDKLSWIMQRPGVAAKLQIRQSLRNFAEKTWRSRTSTL
ncbi:ras-related protein Rap-2a-like [Babylonia areolata]|uniref:ras-related protein Rap-2a-like n=1 Tax=Babylonia areolata TaxID=304850 RepID=UPI003FD3FFCB